MEFQSGQNWMTQNLVVKLTYTKKFIVNLARNTCQTGPHQLSDLCKITESFWTNLTVDVDQFDKSFWQD